MTNNPTQKEFTMLSEERKEKLNPILELLREINGVESVTSDDWDSHYVNVFLWIKGTSSNLCSRDYRFTISPDISIRGLKAGVKNKSKNCFSFNFLDWPTPKYHTLTFFGKRETIKEGYDSNCIKIEVAV